MAQSIEPQSLNQSFVWVESKSWKILIEIRKIESTTGIAITRPSQMQTNNFSVGLLGRIEDAAKCPIFSDLYLCATCTTYGTRAPPQSLRSERHPPNRRHHNGIGIDHRGVGAHCVGYGRPKRTYVITVSPFIVRPRNQQPQLVHHSLTIFVRLLCMCRAISWPWNLQLMKL